MTMDCALPKFLNPKKKKKKSDVLRIAASLEACMVVETGGCTVHDITGLSKSIQDGNNIHDSSAFGR